MKILNFGKIIEFQLQDGVPIIQESSMCSWHLYELLLSVEFSLIYR